MENGTIKAIKAAVALSEYRDCAKVVRQGKNACAISVPNNGQALESVVLGMGELRTMLLEKIDNLVGSSIYAGGKIFYFLVEIDSL